MEGSVEDFCYRILDLHKGIRFAGLASSSGRLVSQAYRRGLNPLASKNESESSILSTFAKMDARAAMEKTYGRTVYAFALYENLKRATIPVKEGSKISHILVVTFDTDVEHEPIILKQILPRLNGLFE